VAAATRVAAEALRKLRRERVVGDMDVSPVACEIRQRAPIWA